MMHKMKHRLMFFDDLIFFIFFELLTMPFQIYLYISMQFQVGKSSNEPYTTTMGNETTLDFKSKLEKIETLRKDNDKEALKDDPLDATVVHVFPHQLSPNIFKQRKKVKKSHILQHPFTYPTKRRKLLMSKTDITSSIFDSLRPPSMEAKVAHTEYINDEIEEE